MSAKAFFSFFQRTDSLKFFFNTQGKSDIFYSQIRCGLLHQGQTKAKSVVHMGKGNSALEWIDVGDIKQGVSIQRRLFHKEVIKVYESYVSKLETPHDLNFRRKFARKMQSIINQN